MPQLFKGYRPYQNLTVQSDHLVLSRLPNGLFVLRHRTNKKDGTSLGNNPAVLFEVQELIDAMLEALQEEQNAHHPRQPEAPPDHPPS